MVIHVILGAGDQHPALSICFVLREALRISLLALEFWARWGRGMSREQLCRAYR
jgi:hypothetical protein